MKQIVSALSLTLILAALTLAQSKTSKEIDGLVGPVHTVTTVHLQLTRTEEGIWTEGPRTTDTIITYDEKGNDGRFRGGSPLARDCPRKHNEKGQEIEVDCEGPSPETTVKTFWSYDEAGHTTEMLQRDGNGKLIRRYATTFDGKGNVISGSTYDSEDKLQRKLMWTFDEKGNRTEWTESHAKGEEMVLFERIVSTYDDKGNVLTETQYGNPEGTITTHFFSYEFDQKGNWIRRESCWMPLDSADLTSKQVDLRFITYYEK
ncbi:MAG TPA: hypothetical protein DC054_21185 [Blastocatellia bacterium]|nr:hypothetical protein [Blastocatellia bacterium]